MAPAAGLDWEEEGVGVAWGFCWTCSVYYYYYFLTETQTGNSYCTQNPDRTAKQRPLDRRWAKIANWETATHTSGSPCQSHTHVQLTTIARIHSKCQEANISSRIWFLSRLSSQGSGLGSLWIDYSKSFSFYNRNLNECYTMKMLGLVFFIVHFLYSPLLKYELKVSLES